MKGLLFLLFALTFFACVEAQSLNCEFKDPIIQIDFGSGDAEDINALLPNYDRVYHSCPSDGHYTYTSYTSDCFRGDWLTLEEDHTPGDARGNMMIVNSSYTTGTFFSTTLKGLQGGKTYEFSVWMMNVCRISEKCPFPLLPNITIRLQTISGTVVAKFGTGEVQRRHDPYWTRYRAVFVAPPSQSTLMLVMTNSQEGGCGNDFALDDITIRECIKTVPKVNPPTRSTTTPSAVKKPAPKPTPKKTTPDKVQPRVTPNEKPQKDTQRYVPPIVKREIPSFPPAPAVLTRRTNTLVKQIETETGEIRIDLYDNGEIDGDTVSIYHNNTLVMAHARLSQKPLTFRIAVDANHPLHELVMVAENLGSIPPNTSLMIITAGSKRYQAFLSSTEEKNAKVTLQLKE